MSSSAKKNNVDANGKKAGAPPRVIKALPNEKKYFSSALLTFKDKKAMDNGGDLVSCFLDNKAAGVPNTEVRKWQMQLEKERTPFGYKPHLMINRWTHRIAIALNNPKNRENLEYMRTELIAVVEKHPEWFNLKTVAVDGVVPWETLKTYGKTPQHKEKHTDEFMLHGLGTDYAPLFAANLELEDAKENSENARIKTKVYEIVPQKDEKGAPKMIQQVVNGKPAVNADGSPVMKQEVKMVPRNVKSIGEHFDVIMLIEFKGFSFVQGVIYPLFSIIQIAYEPFVSDENNNHIDLSMVSSAITLAHPVSNEMYNAYAPGAQQQNVPDVAEPTDEEMAKAAQQEEDKKNDAATEGKRERPSANDDDDVMEDDEDEEVVMETSPPKAKKSKKPAVQRQPNVEDEEEAAENVSTKPSVKRVKPIVDDESVAEVGEDEGEVVRKVKKSKKKTVQAEM